MLHKASRLVNQMRRHGDALILGVAVALVSLLSFAAGYLAAKEDLKEPLRVERAGEPFTEETFEE